MTAMSEDQIRRVVTAPGNLEIALAVDRHWPAVRADIVRRFAERMSERIAARLREDLNHLGELNCQTDVTGGNDRWQAIRVFRDGDAWLVDENRVEIRIEAQHAGPQGWIVGVSTGQTNFRRTLEDPNPFREALGRKNSSRGWPWYEWVEQPWGRWLSIVPTLASELNEDGDATAYFVNRVAEVCKVAVPIIDRTIREYRAVRESPQMGVSHGGSAR